MPTPVAFLLKSPLTTLSFGRRASSGWSVLLNSMSAPLPLAHQWFGLMPQPMKRAANRFGQADAPLADAPQTGSDSSHGNAIVTPTPRRKVRRLNACRWVFIALPPWLIRRHGAGGGTAG